MGGSESKPNFLLIEAIKARDLDTVKEIIESKKVPPNEVEENGSGKTALHYAVAITNNSTIYQGRLPQTEAQRQEYEKLQAQKTENNNNNNNNPITTTENRETSSAPLPPQDVEKSLNVHSKHRVGFYMTKMLVEAGWDVNQASEGGGTCLHIACVNGNPDTVRFLVQNNANVFALNSSGISPIHSACFSSVSAIDATETINILVEAGKKIKQQQQNQKLAAEGRPMNAEEDERWTMTKIRTRTGETALHLAAKAGNLRALQVMLDAGADVDCQIVDKQNASLDAHVNGYASALTLAIDGGHVEVVQELLHPARKCKLVLPAGLLGFRSLRDYARKIFSSSKSQIAISRQEEMIRILPDQSLVISERYKGKKARSFQALAKANELVVYDSRQPITKIHVEEAARLAVHTRDVLFLTFSNPLNPQLQNHQSNDDATNNKPNANTNNTRRNPVAPKLFLATAAADWSIHLWDGETGLHEVELKGHTNTVWSIVFANDNRTMYSAGADLTIRTWDLTSYFPNEEPHQDSSNNDENEKSTKKLFVMNASTRSEASPGNSYNSLARHYLFPEDKTAGLVVASASSPANSIRSQQTNNNNNNNSLSPSSPTRILWNDNQRVNVSSESTCFVGVSGCTVQEVAITRGHEKKIESLAISPDSKLLISCSMEDKRIVLWDIAFSPSGIPKKVRVISEAGPKGIGTRAAVFDRVLPDFFSSSPTTQQQKDDADDFYSSSSPSPARSMFSSSRLLPNQSTFMASSSMFFSPTPFIANSSVLYTGSWDRNVQKWDVLRGTQNSQVLGGHTEPIHCIALSPDGKQIATASYDNTVRLWNAEKWSEVFDDPLPQPFVGHSGKVWCVAFSPLHDSGILASCSEDETVRFWNTLHRTKSQPKKNPSTDEEDESDDEQQVANAAASANSSVMHELSHEHSIIVRHRKDASRKFDNGGNEREKKNFASADKDDELMKRMEQEGDEDKDLSQILRLGSPVNFIAFSPNGAVLACALQNELVRLFSVGVGEVFVPLTSCRAYFTKISFGPKGRMVEFEDICGKKKAFNLLQIQREKDEKEAAENEIKQKEQEEKRAKKREVKQEAERRKQIQAEERRAKEQTVGVDDVVEEKIE